jgi:hypothetical protein
VKITERFTSSRWRYWHRFGGEIDESRQRDWRKPAERLVWSWLRDYLQGADILASGRQRAGHRLSGKIGEGRWRDWPRVGRDIVTESGERLASSQSRHYSGDGRL